MNYLAHFQLAWPDEGLLVGALEGDYRKGPLRGELPGDVEQGVRLHRAIDAYTDQHPAMAELRRCFEPAMQRYAGILVDLSFDHYLTLHWSRFADTPLDLFRERVYRVLHSRRDLLSPPALQMAERMLEHDILGLYDSWDNIPASAARIGERFRRGNPFHRADEALAPLRPTLEQAFLYFYPQLQAFSELRRRHRN